MLFNCNNVRISPEASVRLQDNFTGMLADMKRIPGAEVRQDECRMFWMGSGLSEILFIALPASEAAVNRSDCVNAVR